MTLSPSVTNSLFLLTVLIILLPAQTYAFGAGDIPDFAYLNDKAFRHGDIESILETLVKSAGGVAIGGGSLLGFATSVIKHARGPSKFSKSDVKKVYFGNWLRDYSQAMDIAGLSKLSAETLVLVVSVLGFMTFGFATQEFEVTADRLGVYLPVEHIDNPKGYAEAEGDARNYHPKLRPPVDPRELEVDERTGMKNYIATEDEGWDTSTAFIRRTFRSCIEHGRNAGGHENADLWEAYRLLGTGLHTMEDLLAHSNWCELALRKIGYENVFCHVGDNVIINTPNGEAPPLVTGTFGSADFLHSLLGEAGDKLSQASVTDLSQKISDSSQNSGSKPNISALKNIISQFGGGEDDKLNKGEEIKKQSQGYRFDPDNVCPPDVQQKLLELLKWRDDVIRDIIKKIEMVPGLENLLDEFSNALNEYVYTVLAPYLGPILSQATSVLDEGSKAVIDNDDQYEVFNNPDAHDPSHSLLSKDHFGLILNEPAGKIAQLVVENSVNLIVPAWSSDEDADRVIDQILEAFHHPYYATGHSEIQNAMFDHMQRWIGGMGSEADEIIESLTKESIRQHKNKRKGLEDTTEAGYGGCGHGHSGYKPSAVATAGTAAYAASSYSSGNQESYNSSGYGHTSNDQYQNNYNSGNTPSYGQSYGRNNTSGSYGSERYGSQRGDDDYNNRNESYGGRRNDGEHESSRYGQQGHDEDEGSGHGRRRRDNNENSGYGGYQTHEDIGYGGQVRRDDGYSHRSDNNEDSGYSRYQRREGTGYGVQSHPNDGQDNEGSGYNSYQGREDTGYDNYNRRNDEDHAARPSYGQGSYGESEGYERNRYGRDNDNANRGGYSRPDEVSYGRRGEQEPSGYNPSYAPSYGNDDTFGAERLNLGRADDDDDDDDDGGRRHHHHHNRRHH